jgi:hypothetical protein
MLGADLPKDSADRKKYNTWLTLNYADAAEISPSRTFNLP